MYRQDRGQLEVKRRMIVRGGGGRRDLEQVQKNREKSGVKSVKDAYVSVYLRRMRKRV